MQADVSSLTSYTIPLATVQRLRFNRCLHVSRRVFSQDEVETIRKVRLYDIILATTNISRNDIQEKVFFHTADDPCPQPLQLNASLMEPCRYLSGHDYFQVGTRTAGLSGACFPFIFVLLSCEANGRTIGRV